MFKSIKKYLHLFTPLVFAIVAGVFATTIVYAAIFTSASGGGAVTQFTTSWGDCRSIQNNNGLAFFIPANTLGEWNAFLTNAPNKTANSCVDGGWSSFGTCSATCGGGIQTRTCTNPSPAYGGADCVGSASQSCNTQACPIDGGWSSFGTCSATCGGGIQTRTCTNPSPAYGGADCVGSASQSCNTQACAVTKYYYVVLGEYSDGPEYLDCTVYFADGSSWSTGTVSSGPPSYYGPYTTSAGYSSYSCTPNWMYGTPGDYWDQVSECSSADYYGSCTAH